MGTVKESFETFPFDVPPRLFERREEQLLGDPHTRPGAPRTGRDHPPIEVVHLGVEYADRPFAPPTGVYESEFMRLEWQTMNGRQPFYHRNCDVDEMSFQVTGVRTLMTDLGSVDLVAGDFSRIPVGAVHDNYGREDIHVLFYVPAPVHEAIPAERTSQVAIPPFDGWEPGEINEMTTECLAGPGHDIVLAPTDETALLEQAATETERIQVLRPGDAAGTTWVYRSSGVLIGRTCAQASDGRVYRRVRNAQEIQYQLSGHRTLVTQRGTVRLGPGDFVKVPTGIAFTSIHHEPSTHLTVASARELPRIAGATRTAERLPAAEIEALR